MNLVSMGLLLSRVGIFVWVVLLAACVTKSPIRSGFLTGYGSLEPDPDVKGVYFYRNPKRSVEYLTAQYTRFIMDPVMVFFHPDAIGRGVNPDDLKSLTDGFRRQLIAALEDGYPLVEFPAPGVARIRVAIANLLPRKPRLTYNSAATAFSLDEATLEVEFIDSKTGERLVALMDTRLFESGPKLQKQSMKRHARGVIRQWTQLLRTQLDKAYGK
jgi:hypothetical protein